MTGLTWRGALVLGLLGTAFVGVTWAGGDEVSKEAGRSWYGSVAAGALDFEGDEAVDDGAVISARLGCDWSEDWSLEGGFDVAPSLTQGWRTDSESGERISRLREKSGVDDTWSMRLVLDGLRHFTRWEKFDPFLAVGAGVIWYADTFDKQFEPLVQGGGGCFYHLNDQWALRADMRVLVAGVDTEANSTYTLGVAFRPGQGVAEHHIPPPPPPAVLDSDADGLSDAEEMEKYKTDPMNADSDWDALSDGDEVRKYMTDPLNRDTDGGGVYDGHEVIEDATNPKAKDDDLQSFELRLMFDPDDWKIKSEYFSEIGVIGKILKDNPAATARVEGHLDRTKDFSERKAKNLTERRAEAVRDYLAENWKIEPSRVTAVGYGSSRPKGPNDPVKGNAENRRIEIYIRGSSAPVK